MLFHSFVRSLMNQCCLYYIFKFASCAKENSTRLLDIFWVSFCGSTNNLCADPTLFKCFVAVLVYEMMHFISNKAMNFSHLK